MTAGVRPWLPANLAEGPAVKLRLSQAVSAWREAWFPDSALSVTSLKASSVPLQQIAGEMAWRLGSRGVGVSGSARARTRLVEAALGARDKSLTANETDHQLLTVFEGALLDDLLQRVAASLDAPPSQSGAFFASREWLLASVSDSRGGELLSLAMPTVLAAPFCHIAAAPPSPAAFASVEEALASLPISIEVLLGEAEISLSELRQLGPGDVVMLDTELDDLQSVRLVRANRLAARAKLTDLDGALAVTLQPF